MICHGEDPFSGGYAMCRDIAGTRIGSELEPVAVTHQYTVRCRHRRRLSGIVSMPESSNETVGSVIIVAVQCRFDIIGK